MHFLTSKNPPAKHSQANHKIISRPSPNIISSMETFLLGTFSTRRGVTVPTGLSGPTYDNRTAGDALISSSAITGNNDGQVVLIAPNTTSTSFKAGQLTAPGAFVQSGLGHQVNLTTLDGTWDGGRFHIVDWYFTSLRNPISHTASNKQQRKAFSPSPKYAPRQSAHGDSHLSTHPSTAPVSTQYSTISTTPPVSVPPTRPFSKQEVQTPKPISLLSPPR
jgi:hypothetical protein